ncbi:ferric citrate ABC transporter ATP-binding protein FecE [Aliivibrio sp. 1S165]|uniref:Fe(3+) dicitrate ABC transporter ATP-binding protein FecE n=1 Tax=unclassified Aliivibrio TaxID=2645654 RepID=UPI00080EE676|nr:MULTISPECIES: Fe(3+) dicitrate ABC transporter ATP-binding protein FecE [unclassified Aliivibrio]OCH14768.1 ferric citrate ABC transporter ATP-binding protein FecE [Aliivibrio sp. 1S165]OCH34832.1 ferric citrate ABC transporter ATP-binding protein FecE [Aliivibrio sp. 1S175]
MLETQNLSVAYGKQTIIPNLSVSIPKGKITALIGPNGCGKSTLLKTLVRINKPIAGDVLFENKSLSTYGDKILARSLSLLPQILINPEGITVRKLVEYGRSPYVSHWGRLGQEDQLIVEQAMRDTGVFEFADKPVESLSGGQRQRAWIAMVIAQDTDVVMLDEPTTYLDMSHQVELMNLMQQMNAKGKTVVVVLHDLNQACRYCDHLVVLDQGRLVTEGSPDQVLTENMLSSVFDLKARVFRDPISNTPMCVAI